MALFNHRASPDDALHRRENHEGSHPSRRGLPAAPQDEEAGVRPAFRPLTELYCSTNHPICGTRRSAANIHATKEHHMSFYDASVPAFLQILGSLSGILTKAEAHCATKNIQPEVLLGARLYPDMLPLNRQIQLACDFATKGCARLAHIDVPSVPDTEKTFEELRQRLAKASDYLKTSKSAQFEGADT